MTLEEIWEWQDSWSKEYGMCKFAFLAVGVDNKLIELFIILEK